jgi:flagellin
MNNGSTVQNDTFSDARYLSRVQDLLTRSMTRLSSGSRLVSAADDPAAVGHSEKLIAQNRRIDAASTNVQNATSLLQTKDSQLSNMNDVVTRMSELAVLAKDVMKNGGDIALYQTEFTALQDQLRSTIGGTTAEIGGTTPVSKPLGTFNGVILFGSDPAGMTVAAGASASESITIPETNLRNGAMLALIQQDGSGNYTLNMTDPSAVAQLTAGIQDLADERSTVGAVTSRFQFAAAGLTQKGQDLTQDISQIQDVDVAAESTQLAKFQALVQGGTAVLVQANTSARSVLKLLQ